MILLTRKAEFSAAHYYWNDAFSDEENARTFGKCANKNGHGHNYTLEVTVEGNVAFGLSVITNHRKTVASSGQLYHNRPSVLTRI